MPICHAKKGTSTAPNFYELDYYCLSLRYKECPTYMEHQREGEVVRYNGVERRKHQRFKVSIPVNIGLINLRGEKAINAQFRGRTTDISMEGLGLELKFPESGLFPFGTRLMGDDREYDLEINARVGKQSFRGVGEVRWVSTASPSIMKMGVLLKEIVEGETGRWRDFVMNRNKGAS